MFSDYRQPTSKREKTGLKVTSHWHSKCHQHCAKLTFRQEHGALIRIPDIDSIMNLDIG